MLPVYIETVPNRNSPPATLLRRGWREGSKTLKRTLANPSPLAQTKRLIPACRLLQDEPLVSPQDFVLHPQDSSSRPRRSHPDGDARSSAWIPPPPTRCRERDPVMAMIAARLLHPCSKLATTREWHTTTLAEGLSVADATEDDLYQAMDWLMERQPRIGKKLAARHLGEDCLVLYDVSSSCTRATRVRWRSMVRHRDGNKGLPIIVYGVMTNGEGRPIAVEVYPRNTGDSTTVVDQVEKLRDRFQLSRVVLVGETAGC